MLVNARRPQNYLDDVVSLSNKLAKIANKRDAKSGISEIEIKCLRESGLLTLMVPKEYGGIGATWTEALKVIQKIAKADGLIGQLYGYHLNLTVLAHVLGTPQQKEKYYQQTALNNGFWANAINTWDTGLKISLEGENFHLNGVTAVDGVVAAADFWVFSAVADSVREPFFFIIPKDRKGIVVNNNLEKLAPGKTDSIRRF
jgi:alkylation response protein AidB-like acyl-CoA dehydrogenase